MLCFEEAATIDASASSSVGYVRFRVISYGF
jgi:hypothetical protein